MKLLTCSLCLLIFVMGVLLQQQIFISHDVSWHILIAKRLLQGGSYTHDFMDISPPAIIYSKIPVLWLIKCFHLTMPQALRIYIFILKIVSLLLCWKIVWQIRQETLLSLLLLTTIAFSFFCLPLSELGQRDDMVLVLTLPWFFAYAAAFENKSLSKGVAIAVAIYAGFGFIIHIPYFIIYVIFESYFYYAKKKFRFLENSIILSIAVVYALTIVICHNDYLTLMLPLITWIYLGMYNSSWLEMFVNATTIAALITATLFLSMQRKYSIDRLGAIFFYLLILYIIPFIWTGKLWYYHMLPTITITLLLSIIILNEAFKLKLVVTICFILSSVLLLLLDFYNYFNVQRKTALSTSSQSQFLNYVKKYYAGKSVYVFSDKMTPQLMIAYSDVNIASRMAPTWLAVGIVAKEQQLLGNVEQERLMRIRALQFNSLVDDFLRYKPELVLVKKTPIDFIGFFQKDSRFKKLWMNYHFLTEGSTYSVYTKNNTDLIKH